MIPSYFTLFFLSGLSLALSGCQSVTEAYWIGSSRAMAVEWSNARIVCAEMRARGETPVWPCP